jgi:LacI family transcriptional regulator
VFNESGPVKEATRRRVQSAAAALRYAPHGAARSLTTRRTNTVGVLLPDLYGEFFSEIIRGVDQAAQRVGFHLLVSSSHDSQEAIEAAMHAMRGRVDGLIVMCPDLDAETLAANLPKDLPVVLLDSAAERGKTRPRFDMLTIDNYGGAFAMVTHLIGLGHRQIAMIKGPARNQDARERLRGFRAALRKARLDAPPQWQLEGDFTEAAGYHAVRDLLALAPRPTAVFAANDSMAVGALSALRDARVNVPREIAIAGFDDLPIARYTDPPLSSVHVPISDLGRMATEVLVGGIRRRAGMRRQETLPTTLVVRQSCGANPGGNGRLEGVALPTAPAVLEAAFISGG